MPVTPDRIFIYGRFKRPSELPNALVVGFFGSNPICSPVLSPFSSSPDVAVEILREFSATELVGKVYAKSRGGGSWAPSSQAGIREYSWYQDFPRHGLILETEGSEPWKVLYFRQESDESGPYVAVGLKLEPPKAPTLADMASPGSLG
jgi:hypothetical protein